MIATRRYLPISLALLVAASSTGSAYAGSVLDPYAHIKAPQSQAQKKKLEKEKLTIPVADEIEQPTTYVTMPMGNLSEDPSAAADKKTGILGKVAGMAAPFKAAGAGVAKGSKKLGGQIASGAKASGGMAKKSATVIGSGIKSTGDKIKDSTDNVGNKVANKPKQSPARSATIDEMYAKDAQKAVVHNDDGGARAKELLKMDATKSTGMQTAYLPTKGAGKSKLSKLNPFGKLAKKSEKDIRPPSGFLEGANNPDEGVLAEIAKEKKTKKDAENIGVVAEKVAPEDQTAEASKLASAPEKKSAEKKGKLGGLKLAKFKPQMPNFKKGNKAAKTNSVIAAKNGDKAPKSVAPATTAPSLAKVEDSDDLTSIGESGVPSDMQPSTAFKLGDKEIDGAVALGRKPAVTKSTAVASKPDKKNKAGTKFSGGMSAMKDSFSKFNFLNKKKAPSPQTATKDAPKQM